MVTLRGSGHSSDSGWHVHGLGKERPWEEEANNVLQKKSHHRGSGNWRTRRRRALISSSTCSLKCRAGRAALPFL